MDEPRTLCRVDGNVAIVTLNAPQRRNAIDREMVEALHADLERLDAESGLAALVITGAGEKAFAAGADIAQLEKRTSQDALLAINSTLFRRVEEFPVPVIAAIRGFCLGGGCELAMACDLRIAGESARLGQPEVSLGIIPAAGATYRMPRLIGLGRARELIYTGRIVDAVEAERIGLVNRVVPDGEVLDRAVALAREIAHNGPLAVRAAKASMNALVRSDPSNAITVESALQATLFDSNDKRERMRAFLEKRDRDSKQKKS